MSPRLFVESLGGVTVVSFADAELIADDVLEETSAQLNDLAGTVGPSGVVLNFRGVRLMSSTMLAVLLKFSRKLASAGYRLRLCGIDPSLMTAFKITRFDRIFDIYDDESKALESA
jgi:anti-sigma B factor antagonist